VAQVLRARPATLILSWRSLSVDLSRRFGLRFLRHTSCFVGLFAPRVIALGRTGAIGDALRALKPIPLGRKTTMEAENISAKIDNAGSKGKGLAAKAGAKITEVSDQAGNMATDAQGKVGEMTKEGRRRLQKTVQKASHFATEVATKVIHFAQETTQKVAHRASEAATTAKHRGQELADKARDQQEKH